MRYLNYFLIIMLVSCQHGTFNRPIEPSCIGNGDGTAECTFQGRQYTVTNTTNYIMASPESYGRFEKYVIDLERRLEACEAK